MKKDGTILENLKENLNGQNVQGKLDINIEMVQRALAKVIFGYYKALYYQDISYAEGYVDNSFKRYLINTIQKDSKFFKNSNVVINIKNATLKNQTIETINYIKDLTFVVNIAIQYKRENKISCERYLINTDYTEELLFKNYEDGWKLSKVLLQYNLNQTTREI